MKLTVQVTERDIAEGGRSCNDCPIYRALRRNYSGRFWVLGDVIRLIPCNDVIRLPQEAANWIRDYDCRESVQPITFELEVP